jgi:thiosulfate dehydrogenase
MQAAIARGGRLYDRWMGETRPAPATRHPLYTATTEYADKPAVNWRCKECHGWDYRGRDGAYATGKRATGIVGIKRMVGADPAQVVTLLASPQHDFGTRLRTEELRDLALFVTQGQVDMTTVIDAKTKAVLGGDLVRGKAYYGTLCAQCHGEDGTKMKKMPAVGKLANDNPWETLHKILNGEPEEEMPALRALGLEVSRDILRYAQSLPQEKPAATAKP